MNLWPHRLWIRWYPELYLFEGEAERERALLLAKRLDFKWTLLLCMMAVGATGLVIGLVGPAVPSRSEWIRGTISILMAVVVGATWSWINRRRVQKKLRKQLIDKGVPICLHCGYQLRGLTEPRCPECGKPFDPKLLHSIPPDSTRE